MRYVYFVFYRHSNGYGNTDFFCDAPLDNIKKVRRVERGIEDSATNINKVVIENFILINTIDDK